MKSLKKYKKRYRSNRPPHRPPRPPRPAITVNGHKYVLQSRTPRRPKKYYSRKYRKYTSVPPKYFSRYRRYGKKKEQERYRDRYRDQEDFRNIGEATETTPNYLPINSGKVPEKHEVEAFQSFLDLPMTYLYPKYPESYSGYSKEQLLNKFVEDNTQNWFESSIDHLPSGNEYHHSFSNDFKQSQENFPLYQPQESFPPYQESFPPYQSQESFTPVQPQENFTPVQPLESFSTYLEQPQETFPYPDSQKAYTKTYFTPNNDWKAITPEMTEPSLKETLVEDTVTISSPTSTFTPSETILPGYA